MSATAPNNFRYVSGALFIHALIIAVIVAATLYSPRIVVPELGIKAALVDGSSLNPPKPQVDPREQERIEQEKLDKQKQEEEKVEQQRQQEKEEQLRAEQQEKEKQAAQKRIAEAQEAKRQADMKKVEAIKQKQHEVEQKLRAQADAKAQAAREADLKQQLADEEGRNQAVQSGLLNQYAAVIRQRVERNWIKPPSAQSGIKCEVRVTQAVGGMVLSVSFGACNGDAAVRQSIENAVMRSSPLPPPKDPRLFDRNLSFIFNPAE